MIPLCTILCTKPIEEPEPNSEIYEDELDELIKSMAEYSTAEYSSTDHYSCIDDIGNQNNQFISNDDQSTVVDWTLLIEAAKVANENNKRSEEDTANLKIAEYKAANPSWVDRAIRRTFRIKTHKTT